VAALPVTGKKEDPDCHWKWREGTPRRSQTARLSLSPTPVEQVSKRSFLRARPAR